MTKKTKINMEKAMTDHENIMASSRKPVPPHNKCFEKDAKYVRSLKTFGEMGVIRKTGQQHVGKLTNRGKTVMFVGYAKDHADDVYRMFDLQTRKVSQTRDVHWLGQLYGDYKGVTEKEVIRLNEDDGEVMMVPVVTPESMTNNNNVPAVSDD